MKVLVGPKALDAHWGPPDVDGTYQVKFVAPNDRPDPATDRYAPVLLVGRAEERITSASGVVLTYP